MSVAFHTQDRYPLPHRLTNFQLHCAFTYLVRYNKDLFLEDGSTYIVSYPDSTHQAHMATRLCENPHAQDTEETRGSLDCRVLSPTPHPKTH